MSGPGLLSRPGRVEAILLVVALTIRLGWALAAGTDLWMDHVFNDATALSLAEGRGFTASTEEPYDPGIFRTPGYPAFAAGVYLVAGHSVRAVFVVQALLDTLSCLLLWQLASRRAGPAAARWVLLLAATYPFTVWTVGQLSPEVLLVFLSLLLVSAVDRWSDCGEQRGVILVGLLGGVLAWVKPVFLPLPVFLLLAERLRGRPWRRGFVRAIVVGALMAAIIAPWIVRNWRAFGRPVLAGEAGLVLWHGTYDFEPERDAMVRKNFAADAERGDSRHEVTRKRFTDSHQLLENDREFMAKGWERIRQRPLRGFLLDPARRVPRLWISTTFVTGPKWLGAGAAAACLGYLALGALGLWFLRGRIRELSAWWVLPALLTGVYAVIHVEARYTIPARPSLLFLGGVALATLWERWVGSRATSGR